MRLCECKWEYVMLLHWGPIRCYPRPKRMNTLKDPDKRINNIEYPIHTIAQWHEWISTEHIACVSRRIEAQQLSLMAVFTRIGNLPKHSASPK